MRVKRIKRARSAKLRKLVSSIVILFIIGQFAGGCTASKETIRSQGQMEGYSLATAWMLADFISGLYLPHVQALEKAENKIHSGVDVREAVAPLAELPGIEAVVVAAGLSESSFTLPPNFGLSDNNYQKLVADTFVQRKDYGAKAMKIAVHHRLLGGIYRDRYMELRTSRGEQCALVRILNGDSVLSSRLTIGYILDFQWLRGQIPILMDSLSRDNTVLTFVTGPPPFGYFGDHAIQIFCEDPDSSADESDVIWSIGNFKNGAVPAHVAVWPFIHRLTVSVKTWYQNPSK